MSHMLSPRRRSQCKSETRKDFPVTLTINEETFWCKKVQENNYEKFVTSKGTVLFAINTELGNGWSTSNSPDLTEQLVKDSRLISLLCGGKRSEYKPLTTFDNLNDPQKNDLYEDFISHTLGIEEQNVFSNGFKSFEIDMVPEGSNVKISDDNGVETWKICKDTHMFKNMNSMRGNRYFVA